MFVWTIGTILVFGFFLTLLCKFPSITHFFGKSHFFKLSGKWIYFVEVSSEKPLCVWSAPAGFCVFHKIDISGFWRHARSAKSAVFCVFCNFWMPFHRIWCQGKGRWRVDGPCKNPRNWGARGGWSWKRLHTISQKRILDTYKVTHAWRPLRGRRIWQGGGSSEC